jgi:hypothetical protein
MPTYKLSIELVPSTSWYNNIRALVSKSDWEVIKDLTFKRAGYKCEICGGTGPKWPVECHEVWHYDDTNHTQKLVRTIALCPNCHCVKHMGLQMSKFPRRVPNLIKHMMKVNVMTYKEAEDYIVSAFKEHAERSRHPWDVDITWIKKRFPNMNFKES